MDFHTVSLGSNQIDHVAKGIMKRDGSVANLSKKDLKDVVFRIGPNDFAGSQLVSQILLRSGKEQLKDLTRNDFKSAIQDMLEQAAQTKQPLMIFIGKNKIIVSENPEQFAKGGIAVGSHGGTRNTSQEKGSQEIPTWAKPFVAIDDWRRNLKGPDRTSLGDRINEKLRNMRDKNK